MKKEHSIVSAMSKIASASEERKQAFWLFRAPKIFERSSKITVDLLIINFRRCKSMNFFLNVNGFENARPVLSRDVPQRP